MGKTGPIPCSASQQPQNIACLEHVLALIPQVSLEPGQELLPGVPGGLGPVSLVALPLEGVAGAGGGPGTGPAQSSIE